MNDAMSLLAPALAETLLRFVWEGAAIGALAWAALVLLRDARAQARYAVACLALLSCLLVPAAGLLQALLASDAPAVPGHGAPMPFAGAVAALGAIGALGGIGNPTGFTLPGNASAWIVAAWAAGVVALSLRMACGLLWVGWLRRAPGPEDAAGAWQQRVDRLAARLGIARRVALRLAHGEGSPLTAGWWRPVVVLPIGVATRMPVELVEALLAHELAHVRRHDYLVNLFQGAAEALLFYHPVVWWLSHRTRTERELVADDLAAAALGDRRRLALALADLARAAPGSTGTFRADAFPSHLAPAAHGGQLMSRIQQLLRPQRRSAGAVLALPLIGLVLAGAAFYAHAHLAPQAGKAPAASDAPAADAGSSYALVRAGEDGITMSGNMDDRDDIEAARAGIDGDFLWFRRDGRAWVVRDAATLARARQAWTGTQAIEKEMHALEAKMQPHSARMEALSQRMQALHVDDAFDSPEGREAQAGIQAVAAEMHALAGERMQLAQRERRAGDDAARTDIDRAMAALDQRQAVLDAKMQRHNATMEQLGARVSAQQAPMEALSREMDAAARPMDAIGKDMGAVGARIEREARIADRQVRSLIDQAWRDGRAEPAPVRR